MKVVGNVALVAGASLLTQAAVAAVRTVTWKPEALKSPPPWPRPRRWTARAPTVPGIVIGATDSRWFGPVAERVYRFAPFLVPFEELSRFHGTNERVSVENLDRAAEFYTRVIATTAG